ncbi:hypothetical protein GALL_171540 [mine drainage metagenome]|uniref:Uncharacterized protein n=1 Tax=mine drainage metagenome TaxID=410659 RepID=A0A1J5RXF1_9ZZZZ
MPKLLSVLAVGVGLAVAAPALAQTMSGPNGPNGSMPGMSGQMGPGMGRMPFPERRQRLLERLGREVAILQQEQACVQGAANPPALRNCREQARAQMMALHQQWRRP